MANVTHEPQAIPNPPAPASPKPSDNNSQLTSLANASLRASPPPKSLKRPFQDDKTPPPLTGAAALVDQRRYEEDKRAQESQMKTSNPAVNAKTSLLGQGMSKPSDAPTASISPREPPLPSMTDKQPVEEPMQIDEQTTPATSTAKETARPEANNSHTSTSGDSTRDSLPAPHPREERLNKAMTYPPPLNAEPETPIQHRMSLPASSSHTNSKSPSSTKKHKCPHCATEFTRHHNLKSHLLTHSQEKPYGCQQCVARFRRLHDLKRHLKLHTGERPHRCEKCGRKFARGDALARHSKGPGGCAGRRNSGGDDYDDGDESMEGVVYHGEGSDVDRPDEEESSRRASEPNKMRKTSAHSRVDSGSSSNYRHSSTYPGVAAMSGSRSLYPPQPQGSSSGAAAGGPNQNSSSQHLSPKPPSTAFSQVHYNSPSMFQSGMTESPKPLSPGQPDYHRLSHSESSYPRARSPSLTSQLQQQHLSRNSERSTPPVGLPSMSHAPQLPSLPGLGPDPRHPYPLHQPGSLKPPPAISTQHTSAPPPNSSNPGSATHSSGSSMRELLGGRQSGEQPSADTIEYLRSMERRLQEEMAQRLQHQEQHYEAKIQRLQDEVNTLRGQQGRPPTSPQPERRTSR